MNEEQFGEAIRTVRLMKSDNPNFSAERFIDLFELSEEQKDKMEREFGRKKIWTENSGLYNYFENEYF